jgi:hypothetical protein
MNEKLLHFIWKYGLFDRHELLTSLGEKIEIVNKGNYNTDSGADFQNAKIRIGDTLWVGNIEIHIQSSDWFLHKHENDAAYNNVILHVVYEKKGKPVIHKSGEEMPTLELKSRLKPEMLSRYDQISKRKDWIPCAAFFQAANSSVVNSFLERLLIERLQAKVDAINKLLAESENDWENVMFLMIARYFGAGINKEQFFQLAKSLPVKVWAKHQYDRLQIEALLFGQAGFLHDKWSDEYPNQLRKEYNYLRRLHQLEPMEKHVWKFLRLRPSNFPTVRLAQLGGLMSKEVKFFSQLLESKSIKSIHRFFDTNVSAYWDTHYQFDKPSENTNTHIGSGMKNVLLINAVAPVLFAYGKYKGQEDYCDRALSLLETCQPEGNSIIAGWASMNLKAENAAESQSLLQLKNEYCDKFRCLDCAIGHNILKSSSPA